MKVYRLEHKDLKCGIYRLHIDLIRQNRMLSDLSFTIANEHSSWDAKDTHIGILKDLNIHYYETPFNEELHKKITEKWVCACPTLDKLQEWFGKYLTDCFKHNFVVAEYDVEDNEYAIGDSGKQLMFNREKAKLVRQMQTI